MSDPVFDPTDSKWKCCCGCHVTTGTKIICALNIILYFLTVMPLLALQPEYTTFGIAWLVLIFIIIILPIIGIRKERSAYLIPYLIISALGLIFLIYSFVIVVMAIIGHSADNVAPRDFYGHHFTKEELERGLYVIAVKRFLSALIACWFFAIVFRCYQYLKNVEHTHTTQGYAAPAAVLVQK